MTKALATEKLLYVNEKKKKICWDTNPPNPSTTLSLSLSLLCGEWTFKPDVFN